MAFPFNRKEYKVYSKTFLRKVLVGLSYSVDDPDLDIAKTQDRFSLFLKQRFDLEMDAVDFKERAARVANDEQGVYYLFSRDSAAVIIDARDYRSFQGSVVKYLPALVGFAKEVLNIRVFTSCFIRKLNVFSLEKDEDTLTTMGDAKEMVFSKDFLEAESAQIDPVSSEYGIEKQVYWDNQELTVVARYRHLFPDDRHVQHWLDLEIINKPALPIIAERLEESETWEQMDIVLFDAFHWCVSERIIGLME